MKTLFPGTLIITSAEKVFLVFVALALWLWVYGGSFINSARATKRIKPVN
jgi:hypothetical protein